MVISERIFYILEEKGITQKEFSEKTGISQSTISDWKRKKTNTSADTILKICETLNVTPYELLSERNNMVVDKVEYLIALNDQEAVLLEEFRSLDNRKKDRLMGYLDALKSEK